MVIRPPSGSVSGSVIVCRVSRVSNGVVVEECAVVIAIAIVKTARPINSGEVIVWVVTWYEGQKKRHGIHTTLRCVSESTRM